MTRYYSQHGEDALLDLIFKDQKDGFFVEVGCIDGRCFSNTLTFEERGWKGLCVEAHAGYIEMLTQNRPNSIVCHCAAGESDEQAVFYANARGSLSSLDKSTETRWKRDYAPYFSGFEEQEVRKVRLSTLLDEHRIERIDILSLDIEGYEVEAMKGLDLSRHKPRVMVIESDSHQQEQKLDEMILPHGYTKSVTVSSNLFYVYNKELDRVLRGARMVAYLTHCQHPLDGKGRWIERVEIGSPQVKRSPSILAKLRNKLSVIRKARQSSRQVSTFVELGFHGDEYLLTLADCLGVNSKVFVETGANVGSTLAYVATNHAKLSCFSCEPDPTAFSAANSNAGKFQNVTLYRGSSQQFITYLKEHESWIFLEKGLFWLDAHGYGFEWPLKNELEFITSRFDSAYILIDDFKVPGRDDFKYDIYQEQICSYDFVKDALNPRKTHQLYYPTYKDKTSKHHPLCGWGLLVIGHDDFQIPEPLVGKMERAL